MKVRLLALLGIAFVALAPFVPVVAAGVVAGAAGCTLTEAGTTPCVIAGRDFGALLSGMGVLGWLGLVSFPLAGLLFVAWTVWVLVTFKSLRR